MDTETEDLYVQKIEEFVYDEDKIITFKWLSTTLNISPSDSRRLLKKYVIDHRDSKPDDLAVTYVVSGLLSDENVGVIVVKEEELEDTKESLVTVMSEQIYSIQKCKHVDFATVSLVDYFDMHNPRESPLVGSVISKRCVKRVFKPKKALPPPPPPTIKGKMSYFTKVPPKSCEKMDANATGGKSNSGVKETAATKQKQNGLGIAGFFNKLVDVADVKAEVLEKLINGKINKSDEKCSTTEVKKESTKMKDKIKNLVDSDSDADDSSSQSQSASKSKENHKPKHSNKRQRKETKKSAPSPKRRKRIIEQDESDDDIFGNDELENDMHENVIENSDEDPEPILKPKIPLGPKNKKRKLVDRTFEDEEGFIITRKEWVEESPSEDEVELAKPEELRKKEVKEKVVVKNEVKKANKSESNGASDKPVIGKAKAVKGKKVIAANQQTLTSFFKRK